jgi:diguanylate cyclase (GGDEF)-like protein/PAS domain S-box-containing protein
MTDQYQTQYPTDSASTPLEQRLAQRQSWQMIGQFQFFSFISLISVVTVGFLYWKESSTLLLSTQAWLIFSLIGIGTSITAIQHLKHHFQTLSIEVIEKRINYTAFIMGSIWGVATITFSPDFPLNTSNQDFYRSALLACLISWQAIAALTCYSSRFETFIYFSVTTVVPALLLLTTSPSVMSSALTGIGGLFFFFILLAGRRLSDLSHQSLWLQLRNEDLIHFLENSKSTVETVNHKLSQEVNERRHTETQLQEVNSHLEQKVRERTLALSDINRALRNSQERLTLAIDASGIGLWDWNMATNEVFHSNFEQLLGYSKLEMKSLMGNMKDIIHPEDYPDVRHALLQHLRNKKTSYEASYRILHRAGHWIWIEDNGRVVARDEKGQALRLIGTRRDISPEREIEEKLRLSASVFEYAAEGIYILDADFCFLSVNPRFSQMTGFSNDDVEGKHLFSVGKPLYPKESLYLDVVQQLKQTGDWQGELLEHRKNGEAFSQWLHITAIQGHNHKIAHYVGIVSDLTQHKETEEKLKYLANYDKLTGLANRTLFYDRLHSTMSAIRDNKDNAGFAILYIDLDRFRQLNDSLGHELGDILLKKVAERISLNASDANTIARLGSDEFALLLDKNYQRDVLEPYCEVLINQLRRPFKIGEHELLLGASIGVSLFPEHGQELQLLINNADLALQQAKRMGGNTTRFFSSNVKSISIEQINLESALRKAIFRDEFVVFYQPKLCLKTNRIMGAEALVRWQHPTLGLLGPGQFIPLAEEAGLIAAIGEIVLLKACQQTALWHTQGFKHLSTSVNVVAQQLQRGNLLHLVDTILASSALNPTALELELTESSLMDEKELVRQLLDNLRERGIKIALDDFGTGYSSLSYLRDFPIDVLKIDQSFVFRIGQSDKDDAIVKAIFAMGHSLGMDIIAEGVETVENLDFLQAQGCDMVQGYLISRPVPAEQFTAMLNQAVQ